MIKTKNKMALVDYRGYRVTAISVLPIKKNTIIYGKQVFFLKLTADYVKIRFF